MIDERIPYERDVLPFMRPFTDRLVASIDLTTVSSMLDHGAGTGEVVCQLREADYRGRVSAFDPNDAMASRLRTNIGAYPDTTIFQGLLSDFIQSHPSWRFDLITSQIVLPFVDDPEREL